MDAAEYKNLSIDKRVEYLNSELKNGNSSSYIFTKILGISKSQASIIKKNGYVLKDNQYIKAEDCPVSEPKTETKTKSVGKSVGRPPSDTEKTSANLILNKREYKIMQVYALLHDTNVSEIVNNFIIKFVKDENLDLNIYKK
ncbi:hypothetical protein [Clostridium autoethanogenum]|uniref:Uncharacterized protein n=1 Tax=Clostridium autoethanogenum DSM 10061 TaxID=1341692 RepID=A0ABY4TPQ3_9CLOT|nr:hypothetical protein [Clostridium autoethanogenum]OVY48500.1 hypothetical protein WX72_00593 [Clostridium autoethanogenum]OVY48507.1 hypothetical protein WX72_00600 [Clostridium autoethanogenum]URS74510.1 hypothetical protein CAETHG_05120 [Clostridium autoethanogenum DSM 10061]